MFLVNILYNLNSVHKSVFDVEINIKRKLKKHNSKKQFRVVSKYKRYFQLKNRFLATSLRVLYFRYSSKWRFGDRFFFSGLRLRIFNFFSYKLALLLKQMLKFIYMCNEASFKKCILNKSINFSNRLDLVCIRVHFFTTVREARIGIKSGFIFVNGCCISCYNYYLRQFDHVILKMPKNKFINKNRPITRLRFFNFEWRIPLVVKFIFTLFLNINQFRLFISRFCLLFKRICFGLCFLKIFFLKIFFCYINLFSFFSYWLLKLFFLLPRSFSLNLFYLRDRTKRSIFRYIEGSKYSRSLLATCRLNSFGRMFKELQNSRLKRKKRGLSWLKYYRGFISYISIFVLFNYISWSYFNILYKQHVTQNLKLFFPMFIPDFSLFNYLTLTNGILKLDALFCFMFCGGIVVTFSRSLLSRGIRDVVLFDNADDIDVSFFMEFGFCLNFKNLFFYNYLFFFNLFFFCFNTFVYFRYFELNAFLSDRLKGKIAKFYLYSNNRFFEKRRFHIFVQNKVYVGVKYSMLGCNFFFNLLIYCDCIDFDTFDVMYMRLYWGEYLSLFFKRILLKFNLFVVFADFFDIVFSLCFFFFNIDNLFNLFYVLFFCNEFIHTLGNVSLSFIYFKFIKFSANFLSFSSLRVSLFLVQQFFMNLNNILCFFELTFFRVKRTLLQIFFYVMFFIEYIYLFFSTFRLFKVAFNFKKICVGVFIWDIIFNKFVLCNWFFNLSLCFSRFKYHILFLCVNNPMNFFKLHLGTFFEISKKMKVSVNFKFNFFNFSFINYIYLLLSFFVLLSFRFVLISVFFYKYNFVILSDSFYNLCIKFCIGFYLMACYPFNLYFFVYFVKLRLILDLHNIYYLCLFSFNLFLFYSKCKCFWNYYTYKRNFFRISPLMLRDTFVRCNSYINRGLRNIFHVTRWEHSRYLKNRNLLCSYLLRYHFKIPLHLKARRDVRYWRTLQANYFFSKSFLYMDVEMDFENLGFIYIGFANSYVRGLQMRFNFFMTLISRFYVHAKSLD